MNKQRMLVEHKISFFLLSVFFLFLIQLKAPYQQQVVVTLVMRRQKKRKKKITDSQTDKREKQFDNKRL